MKGLVELREWLEGVDWISLVAVIGLGWAIVSWYVERKDRKAAESEVLALRGRFERWAIDDKGPFRIDPRSEYVNPGSNVVQQLRIVYQPAFQLDALSVSFRFESDFDRKLRIHGERYDFDRVRPSGVTLVQWTAERQAEDREGIDLWVDYAIDGDPENTRYSNLCGRIDVGSWPA